MFKHLLPFSEQVAGELLGDPETYATVLLIIVLAAYKDDIFGDEENGVEPIDPVELWVRIQDDFRVRVPEENENKLQALMFAIATDAFYEDPLAMTGICLALHDGELGDLVAGTMEDLTVPELLWGLFEVECNRDTTPAFSLAVESLINEVIADEAEENQELEQNEVVPYYDKFVQASKEELIAQCRKLKLPEQLIATISKIDTQIQNAKPA